MYKRQEEGSKRSREKLGVVTTLDNHEVVKNTKLVFLAVKPQFYEAVSYTHLLYGGALFLLTASLVASGTCPADRYSHLPYSLYRISANVFLIYNAEIPLPVPGVGFRCV